MIQLILLIFCYRLHLKCLRMKNLSWMRPRSTLISISLEQPFWSSRAKLIQKPPRKSMYYFDTIWNRQQSASEYFQLTYLGHFKWIWIDFVFHSRYCAFFKVRTYTQDACFCVLVHCNLVFLCYFRTSPYKSPWARIFTYRGQRVRKTGQLSRQEVVCYPRDTTSASNMSDQYAPVIIPADLVSNVISKVSCEQITIHQWNLWSLL